MWAGLRIIQRSTHTSMLFHCRYSQWHKYDAYSINKFVWWFFFILLSVWLYIADALASEITGQYKHTWTMNIYIITQFTKNVGCTVHMLNLAVKLPIPTSVSISSFHKCIPSHLIMTFILVPIQAHQMVIPTCQIWNDQLQLRKQYQYIQTWSDLDYGDYC